MIDLEIRYPDEKDILPFTTTVSINIGDNINALRESILNMQDVLGLNIDTGLFTPDAETATVAERLTRIERGIAERNLVFTQLNVSDAVQVLLNQNNQPFVNLGLGSSTQIAPVTIKGPLTILAAQLAEPRTVIQTPISVDVTTFNDQMSANSLIKGKVNQTQPLLTIEDTSDGYEGNAVHIIGNMKIEGVLDADFAIDHNKLLNIPTVPTDETRGTVLHVIQGMYHTHRKGIYDSDRGSWIVATDTSTDDLGVISHNDLQGWGTLPTHDNSFVPDPSIQYHVTGGDNHTHSKGDGGQIDHNDLKNISPKLSNHVTGGDTHRHTSGGDGGKISHQDLSDINTSGNQAIHVTGGDSHTHGLDEDGQPIGNGGQIDHNHLLNIDPASSTHVTGGDSHAHTSDGDGGTIDHTNLSNVGQRTHDDIDAAISTFRSATTGFATFTSANFNEVEIQHNLGTDQFNIGWSLSGTNNAPPSDPADVGVIYVGDKNSTSFKFFRLGGAIPGPAVAAQLTTNFASANQNITWIAKNPGADGNTISIEYQSETSGDPILGGNPIFVEATNNPPTFIVHFDSGAIPTASDTRAAVLQDPIAVIYLTADLVGDGTGTIGTYPLTNLAGGADTSGFTALELEWTATSRTVSE